MVLPDGRSVGSVGGGIMEYRVQQLASKMQAGEAAPCQLAEYSASAKENDAALAACGGSMNVFLQLLKEEEIMKRDDVIWYAAAATSPPAPSIGCGRRD